MTKPFRAVAVGAGLHNLVIGHGAISLRFRNRCPITPCYVNPVWGVWCLPRRLLAVVVGSSRLKYKLGADVSQERTPMFKGQNTRHEG